jgi:ATP-binding cassette subfamily F protein 3
MKLDFAEVAPGSQEVLRLEDLAVGYPSTGPLLAGIDLRLRAGERIALLGANGTGKTTKIRTIMGELPALAGRVRFGPSTRAGYLSQEQDTLDPDGNALETILAARHPSETDAAQLPALLPVRGG